NPTSLEVAKDIATFCTPQSVFGMYEQYACICATATKVSRCYTVNCPADATQSAIAQNYMDVNCIAAAQLAPPTTATSVQTTTSDTGAFLAVTSAPAGTAASQSSAWKVVGSVVGFFVVCFVA
ncbi:hypothetical protein HDU99_005238, partial [Rhizoclosmatium hyalinum]